VCDDAAELVRDYLLTVPAVTAEVGDHLYIIEDAPDGPNAWGVQCVEVDADRESQMHLRIALVQVTAFGIDRGWNRRVVGIVLESLARFRGYMGTTWVTVSHENETETNEAIGAVHRWAYNVNLTLRYR
jgi:hypothetical protein